MWNLFFGSSELQNPPCQLLKQGCQTAKSIRALPHDPGQSNPSLPQESLQTTFLLQKFINPFLIHQNGQSPRWRCHFGTHRSSGRSTSDIVKFGWSGPPNSSANLCKLLSWICAEIASAHLQGKGFSPSQHEWSSETIVPLSLHSSFKRRSIYVVRFRFLI